MPGRSPLYDTSTINSWVSTGFLYYTGHIHTQAMYFLFHVQYSYVFFVCAFVGGSRALTSTSGRLSCLLVFFCSGDLKWNPSGMDRSHSRTTQQNLKKPINNVEREREREIWENTAVDIDYRWSRSWQNLGESSCRVCGVYLNNLWHTGGR